ncbi:DUF1830 domain-containing protein [Pseudanabaena sp. FACHB-1998]|uniref:DUF1830 domain-containing protein n=1 Tax=Pseudanabaena sp. FACHB-1998 TaxID=2692858 RepID=UPI00168155C6|nr:DUF1830 domain-containing protein [Pseudanabaena sp. FACHB-1998]MBD2177156.1 DUF1830 domain-containing protein [Pseudanabaena sp. FACHB-1998]
MLTMYLNSSNEISYKYINQTQQIQIVRLLGGANECIERAIFPDNDFDFNAPPDAYLEIHTYLSVTSVLSDRIPCQLL